jgi:hypothetical protein
MLRKILNFGVVYEVQSALWCMNIRVCLENYYYEYNAMHEVQSYGESKIVGAFSLF